MTDRATIPDSLPEPGDFGDGHKCGGNEGYLNLGTDEALKRVYAHLEEVSVECAKLLGETTDPHALGARVQTLSMVLIQIALSLRLAVQPDVQAVADAMARDTFGSICTLLPERLWTKFQGETQLFADVACGPHCSAPSQEWAVRWAVGPAHEELQEEPQGVGNG